MGAGLYQKSKTEQEKKIKIIHHLLHALEHVLLEGICGTSDVEELSPPRHAARKTSLILSSASKEFS